MRGEIVVRKAAVSLCSLSDNYGRYLNGQKAERAVKALVALRRAAKFYTVFDDRHLSCLLQADAGEERTHEVRVFGNGSAEWGFSALPENLGIDGDMIAIGVVASEFWLGSKLGFNWPFFDDGANHWSVRLEHGFAPNAFSLMFFLGCEILRESAVATGKEHGAQSAIRRMRTLMQELGYSVPLSKDPDVSVRAVREKLRASVGAHIAGVRSPPHWHSPVRAPS